MTIIDVHTHIVPERFPAYSLPDPEPRWPCMSCKSPTESTVMIQNKPFREIDHRCWDMERRKEDMAAMGVSHQVLSPMPELLSYWFSPAAGLEMCRWMNDTIAEAVSKNSIHFSGLAIVPLQDPDLAAKELAKLKQAGFSGIELGSNINGALLGEAKFAAFFAEVEAQEMCVFVHALHPIGADRLKSFPELIPFAAFPLDTALTAVSLIHSGILERYPKLRIGFSHGGGALIPLVHRLSQGHKLTRGFGNRLTRTPQQVAAGFYYDSLVYDSGYLAYLSNDFAPDQVFAGSDYPFAIMETELEKFITSSDVNDTNSLCRSAAERFLGIKAVGI